MSDFSILPNGDDSADEHDHQPRHPKPRKGTWLRRTLAVLAVVLLVIVGAGVLYAVTIERSVSKNIHRETNYMPAETPTAKGQSPRPQKPTEGPGSETLNYVLMGSDTRDPEAEQGRSDTLMVVHLNAERNQAYIVSFPRDMWVNIPGHGRAKINAAYSYGGPQLAVATLESLVNVRMDHLAVVDFGGFISLTKDLGGVTIHNDHAFSSHGYKFPTGNITISGDEALWFVRERHHLPNGDLDRAANQRKVVQAIVKKGLSGDTISDPRKFTAFVGGIAKYLTVDQSLTDSEIRKTALSLRLSSSNVHQLQAPIQGFGTSSDGQSIDVVDEAKLKELSKALKNDTMDKYLAKYPKG
ncbi:LCP family protein [Microlunatus panaciterrae]|uniref:LCP family protein required for cell wall assembly n=1 Tax=Microlunatus panaciterrae TaxID=400768 RepID=A0ABS2RJJ4_9ACTN|nr:LCP family protein [Microlunatus panaciterrae]MBM7798893.1 LCP family protein required for cell wall assembly [Microlunatus panaciterrae]